NVMSLMRGAPRRHLSKPQGPSPRHHYVRTGDLRLSVERMTMHRKPGHKHTVAHAKPGSSLKILKLRTGPRGHVLWFEARNAKGRTGWIQVRHTLPYGHH